MRIVLSTYGSRGDVEPMLGLAVELQARGADVQLCAPPDFAELAAATGVQLVPAGPAIRALATGPRPKDFAEFWAMLVVAQYDAVVAAADGADMVVATGSFPTVAGARSATEQLGIGYRFVIFANNGLPSVHHPPKPWPGDPLPEGVTDNRELWEFNANSMQRIFGTPVDKLRTSVGLPTVDNVRDHIYTDQPWLATDPVIDPWPATPDLDVVQIGALVRPDDRPLPSELTAFLDAGAPPVYFGFGSNPMQLAPGIAEVSIRAVRAHARRALVSRGWADLGLVDDRDDCFVVDELNHQALFPRVAAVVHHGGAGTTRTAARAGTPQVVVPQVADQPHWASRVAALGIGAAHDGPAPTVESMTAALTTALAPATAARATAVAGEMHDNGASVAATLLLGKEGA